MQPLNRTQPPPTRSRLLVPFTLLVVGAVLIWLVSVWARDALNVHRVTAEPPGAPALILLHGYGAPGDDLVGLGGALAESLAGVQVLVPEAPFRLLGSGRAWYVESPREAIESRELIGQLIDELVAEGTPRGQIAVVGFSQGATMAVDVGLFHADVGCVGALSGRPLDGIGWPARLAKGVSVDVLIAHGRQDRTIALSDGVALAKMLEGAGASVTFVEFEGSHEIPSAIEGQVGKFVAGCLR